jgi:hypothetical protein
MSERGPGDNGGPPLDPDTPEDPDASWRLFCWRKAHRAAWKTPPREIALRRLQRAEQLGMTYRENHDYYTDLLRGTSRNP